MTEPTVAEGKVRHPVAFYSHRLTVEYLVSLKKSDKDAVVGKKRYAMTLVRSID